MEDRGAKERMGSLGIHGCFCSGVNPLLSRGSNPKALSVEPLDLLLLQETGQQSRFFMPGSSPKAVRDLG